MFYVPQDYNLTKKYLFIACFLLETYKHILSISSHTLGKSTDGYKLVLSN